VHPLRRVFLFIASQKPQVRLKKRQVARNGPTGIVRNVCGYGKSVLPISGFMQVLRDLA
jgi:hypothetical protein